jgi:O-antigen ligase
MQALLRKPVYLLAPFAAALYAFVTLRYFSSYSNELLLAAIAVSLGVMLAFTDYSPLFKLLLLVIPVSLETVIGSGDNKMLIPSEPVMMVLAIAFGLVLLFRKGVDHSFLRHPVSVAVLAYLGIMVLGIAVSGMPVVSIKYSVVTLTYILIFYFTAQDFLRKKEGNLYLVFFLYCASMLFVAGRALYLHSTTGFDHFVAGLVVHPYFIDHTIYSVCLTMLFPIFLGIGLKGNLLGFRPFARYLCLLISVILCTAIFFSYCRAAWISIGAALLLFLALELKIKAKFLGLILLLVAAVFWIKRDYVIDHLRENQYTSTNRNSDITEKTLSVGNISNDASNAERLNRWSCALRMFRDKPLTGFGPGTYQFEYLSYQRPDEMTRISVTSAYNNAYGRGGSAHSEYFLALSEMGIGGFIAFTLIVILTIAAGMRAYYAYTDRGEHVITVMALLAFFTYTVHALFNNFLNNNKPASLFWILVAVIVIQDIKSRREKQQQAKPEAL